MIRENVVFLREFLTEFQNTGTCFPTSKWAALELTEPLRGEHDPLNILELGPGTGSVTVQILRDMGPQDTLTICEINERFMKALKERLEENPDFQKHRERITFFQGPVQELPEKGRYEVIVCALPFLNFDREMCQTILRKLQRVSTSSTVMTYYQYIGLRHLGLLMSSPKRRERLVKLQDFFKELHRNQRRRTRVWLNVLPINIYTVKLDPSPQSSNGYHGEHSVAH